MSGEMTGEMSGLKASVQQQFDRVAANYRTSPVHAQGADLVELVALCQLSGRERVLDAGCGAGHAAAHVASHAAEVTALDFTPSMLAQVDLLAQERGLTNIVTRQGDVERLPFEEASFDRVISRYSGHHWPHPARAVAEFRRVLRPGGRLVLADVVGFDDPTCDTFLNAVELLRDPSHVRDYTPREWLGFLAQAGFSPRVAYTWDLFIDLTSWTERMATPPHYVTAIHHLLAGASAEQRAAMKLAPGGFHFACAIVIGE